jgi:hypothetical protein
LTSVAVAFFQRALMRQERRTCHEEDRERRKADVGHRVVALTPRPFALVRKTGADLAQPPDQLFNRAHPALESTMESAHKRKPPDAVKFGQNIHNMLHFGLGSPHKATANATHPH